MEQDNHHTRHSSCAMRDDEIGSHEKEVENSKLKLFLLAASASLTTVQNFLHQNFSATPAYKSRYCGLLSCGAAFTRKSYNGFLCILCLRPSLWNVRFSLTLIHTFSIVVMIYKCISIPGVRRYIITVINFHRSLNNFLIKIVVTTSLLSPASSWSTETLSPSVVVCKTVHGWGVAIWYLLYDGILQRHDNRKLSLLPSSYKCIFWLTKTFINGFVKINQGPEIKCKNLNKNGQWKLKTQKRKIY